MEKMGGGGQEVQKPMQKKGIDTETHHTGAETKTRAEPWGKRKKP